MSGGSNTFKIQQQTEAEKDSYLIDCFHDGGFIDSVIKSDFSIISGRKGTGKTALARYFEQKSTDYTVNLAHRISIRNVSLEEGENFKNHLNSILFFIIIKTIQKLIQNEIFDETGKSYWVDLLTQHGLQSPIDYETFVEKSKASTNEVSGKGIFNLFTFAKSELGAKVQEESSSSRATLSNAPYSLIESLKETFPEGKSVFIFIDDMSDYLDGVNESRLKEDLLVIRDILLNLDIYNGIFRDCQKKLRFVSLIREDLFQFMDGSNINKLINDSLKLEWNEKSFASLLIRRLPFFQDDIERYLQSPIESIKSQFPDNIFSNILVNSETNRYATNFYAYMVAVSFNRPRDFLQFCYAMRNRLSFKHVVTSENIESAEGEYSEYFTKELRDELFLISRVLGHDFSQDGINKLIDLLSQKQGFNLPQIKTDLGRHLEIKTKLGWNKIQEFIEKLWLYGVIGFKEKQDKVIQFKYIPNSRALVAQRLKNYLFYLHRGLYWFAKKRKK